MKVHAIGVFVAPANTATKPIPAMNDNGSGITADKALPKSPRQRKEV